MGERDCVSAGTAKAKEEGYHEDLEELKTGEEKVHAESEMARDETRKTEAEYAQTASRVAKDPPNAGIQLPVIHTETEVRMAKDPLNIGVPMPVVVRRPPSGISARRSRGLAAADAKGRVDAMMKGLPPESLTREHSIPGSFAAEGPGAVSDLEVSLKAPIISREEGGCNGIDTSDASSSVASSRTPVPNPLDLRRSYARELSEPGGFAVGGSTCAADDEASIRTPEESEGSRFYSEELSIAAGLDFEGNTLVQATLVPDGKDEEGRRNLVIHAEAKPLTWSQRSNVFLILGGLVVTAVVVVAIVLSFGLTRNRISTEYIETPAVGFPAEGDPAAEEEHSLPTLELVRERGFLRCGAVEELRRFFGQVHRINVENNYTSIKDILGVSSIKSYFVPNICSAIAAAILGNASAYQVVNPKEEEKFVMLKNRSVDLLFTRSSITMQEDVNTKGVDAGISYSIPYLYGGLGFTGDPFFVDCANDNIKNFGKCSDLTICINEESIFRRDLQVRIPQRQVVIENSWMALLDAFKAGKCNVIATESAIIIYATLRGTGFSGELSVGKREYTSEMWAMKTLDSDPEWSSFLDASLMALLAAEKAGVTKEDAYRMGKTDIFGNEYEDMFINAVAAGGNFGQVYSFPMPRDGRNFLDDGSTGLLASPPLGTADQPQHHDPPEIAGTLEGVLLRGVLQCGIRGDRPGFAVFNNDTSAWEGIDVDYCRALSAALFDGDPDSVAFVDTTSADGYQMLHDGSLDVLAGMLWTLQDDANGFSFSRPYFYGPIGDERFDENLCMATVQRDSLWSSFVYWAAQSLVYAEEHGIEQTNSFELPVIYCFGPELVRMFRDISHALGNYAQVYERHVAGILPRSGRNRLNLLEDQISPLSYVPPGFAILDNQTVPTL